MDCCSFLLLLLPSFDKYKVPLRAHSTAPERLNNLLPDHHSGSSKRALDIMATGSDRTTQLHHQSDPHNPTERPQPHHARPYKLPWYQDTFWGLLINRLSKRNKLPFPEGHHDFVAPEQYLSGYKTRHAERHSHDEQVASPARTSTSASGETESTHIGGNSSNDGNKEQRSESHPPSRHNSESSNLETAPTSMEDNSDPYLVDWNGDSDPDNPLNWSNARKAFVTFLLCLLTFSVYMGSAIYTPGVELVANYFNVGVVTATLGLTLFVLGYGIGPMIGLSSISEIPAIGRNMPYLITLFIFVILQIPTALVTNIPGLMILRFLAGVFGSPPLATGGASIGDMYSAKKRPLAIGVWGLSAVCGPVLGPLIGGFAALKPLQHPLGPGWCPLRCRVHRCLHHHRQGFRPHQGWCQEGCHFGSFR